MPAGCIRRAGQEPLTLFQLGSDPETATRLGRQSKEAEKAIGHHGVSTSTRRPPPGKPARQASRSEVEEEFHVVDTPTKRDPEHKTVILPDPVTKEVEENFNQLFKPVKNE